MPGTYSEASLTTHFSPNDSTKLKLYEGMSKAGVDDGKTMESTAGRGNRSLLVTPRSCVQFSKTETYLRDQDMHRTRSHRCGCRLLVSRHRHITHYPPNITYRPSSITCHIWVKRSEIITRYVRMYEQEGRTRRPLYLIAKNKAKGVV